MLTVLQFISPMDKIAASPLMSHLWVAQLADAAETRHPLAVACYRSARGPISILGKRIAAGGAEPGQVAPPALSVAH